MIEHGAAAAIEILPVTGLPEFRPGDDLTGVLADAAPWLIRSMQDYSDDYTTALPGRPPCSPHTSPHSSTRPPD